jgi:hypothetical protein
MKNYLVFVSVIFAFLLISCGQTDQPLPEAEIQIQTEDECIELARDFFNAVSDKNLSEAAEFTITSDINQNWQELSGCSIEDVTATFLNDSTAEVSVLLSIGGTEVSQNYQCKYIDSEWKLDIE